MRSVQTATCSSAAPAQKRVRGACDTVAVCAADHCEDLGAVGSAIFAACMDPCTGDEAWIGSVNAAQDATGCAGSLDAFEAALPGLLPAGCAEQD